MKNIQLTKSLLALALMQPLLAVAQAQHWSGHGHFHLGHGGWGFGWIFPSLLLLIAVACAVILVRGFLTSGPRYGQSLGRSDPDPTRSALEILHERFAKGEIQRQEFEEKRAAILSAGAP